jgi:putative CocE/NonD family hydrolase
MKLIFILALLTVAVVVASLTVAQQSSDTIAYSSRYLTMRDGVKIAVDLYLPRNQPPDQKLPTLVEQTRYMRAYDITPPYERFAGGIDPDIEYFVEHGYAYVLLDVRGSGASFGSRAQEWSPDEIRDAGEVVDWIIRQPWSNGKVGGTGVSYGGTSAEFLLVNKHPAVKAVAPCDSLFDTYSDMIEPGGVYYKSINELWGAYTTAIDLNQFGEKYLNSFERQVFRGVRPVDEDRDGSLRAAAIREHARNYDLISYLRNVTYRDDSAPGAYAADVPSPFRFQRQIQDSGAAIYGLAGWYDGAFPSAVVNRFMTLKNPGSRLILGPWSHYGSKNQSPWSTHDSFDKNGELLRFFDYYLKGIDNSINRDQPVRYYTVGEERWKTADTWPPKGTKPSTWYFAAGGTLNNKPPTDKIAKDAYRVEPNATTGNATRWNSMVYIDRRDINYGDRAGQDRKLLTYTSQPLAESMEVTGQPTITLYVSSSANDGTFFVYLEDVDEQGHVTYVTEGMLRALHRKLSHETPPYQTLGPYHTFQRADGMPLVPGQVAELSFDLFPISYLFRKGHSVRVALAGADSDHFTSVPAEPAALEFYRSKINASHLILPSVLP